MKSSDRAWVTLGVGVISWDVLCADGMTLSEAVDSYLLRRPLLTRLVVVAVSAHLLNLLSPRIDIIHLGFIGARGGLVCIQRSVRSRGARAGFSSETAYATSTGFDCSDMGT